MIPENLIGRRSYVGVFIIPKKFTNTKTKEKECKTMPRNSVSSRNIRDNGGSLYISTGLQEIGGKQDCGYDTQEWRFDGGIADTRELSWDDIEETEVCVW